ncbi:MAG: peptidase M48, partial [Ectothiorhodospiraceae bacterium]
MDFFGRQDTLRWRTTVLLAAFLLAVAVIVVLIAGVAWVFRLGSGSGESPGFGTWLTHPTGLAVISGVTVYIGAVSLYRWHQLRQGGGNRVARLLGGRFVDPATGDNAERALLRVTEEIAIAAGITAPQVYVLDDEPGLNAFAAGNEPDDA